MTCGMNKMVKGLLGMGTVMMAVAAMPAAARADRWDAGRNGHDRDRDHADRGGWVNVDVRANGGICQPPAVVDRTQQVWVEPVYRTVCDRVWVAPVYQTVCDKVWVAPVVQKQVERVWVPERREVQVIRRGFGWEPYERTVVVPGHYEEKHNDIVITPGHYEDTTRQVVVTEGHWQEVQRQELVSVGHWETRVERVAVAPPPARDGVRIDVRLPIR